MFDEKILKPEGDGINLLGLDLSRFSKMKFIDMPAAEVSDWLIRMLDANGQIVSLSVLKGMREADARGWLTNILGKTHFLLTFTGVARSLIGPILPSVQRGLGDSLISRQQLLLQVGQEGRVP